MQRLPQYRRTSLSAGTPWPGRGSGTLALQLQNPRICLSLSLKIRKNFGYGRRFHIPTSSETRNASADGLRPRVLRRRSTGRGIAHTVRPSSPNLRVRAAVGPPLTRPITQRSPRQQALTWLPSEPPSCGSETNAWLGAAAVPRTLRVRQKLGPAGLGAGGRPGTRETLPTASEQRGGEGRCRA